MRTKLDIPSVTTYGKKISYVCTDSRETAEGDLFFTTRGNDIYISEAQKKGAYIADCSLTEFAKQYKAKLKNLVYTVGITGSVGKTTTKEFLKILLSEKYRTHATQGNYNNDIGLPLTILESPADTELLILEMGMNHTGEISELSKCAMPDIGIITNVGSAHIGNFGTRENIAKAKLELLDGLGDGTLIVPYDEPLLSKAKRLMTFSCQNEAADIFIKELGDGRVRVHLYGASIAEASFKVRGKQFLLCLGAAVSAAVLLKITPDELKNGIEKISNENTRQKILSVGDFWVLADYYNCSYESLVADFELIASLAYQKKSALIGSIYELGEHAERIHRDIGVSFSKFGFDKLYLIGEFSESVRDGALSCGFSAERIFINPSIEATYLTAEQIIKNHTPGEIILFKASRAVRLERILELLKADIGGR